jgi:L-lactate dehydrogenase (cytochrome)
MLRDRDLVLSLIEEAGAVGCETLLFTVDLAVAGMRHRDVRNGMLNNSVTGKLAMMRQVLARPRWMFDVAIKGKPHTFGNLREAVSESNDLDGFKAFIDSQFDPTVTWKDIAWLRSQWSGKLLIKGVLSAEDALAAVDCGAEGVIVSNHGGRQLDGVASTIDKLPEVVAALGDRAEVYMDGGIRNGIDVVRAVALGAQGVLIGRPWVWAAAARGEQGLVDLLQVFRKEIEVAMALTGACSIAELSTELLES